MPWQVDKVTPLVPQESVPFVGQALQTVRINRIVHLILCLGVWQTHVQSMLPVVLLQLRAEVGNASTVLGFVGAPFTLATYIVEGESGHTLGLCGPPAGRYTMGPSTRGARLPPAGPSPGACSAKCCQPDGMRKVV